MNPQQQIKLIETKIQEIKSTLTNWKQETKNYNALLQQLTKQVNEIKKQLTNK